MVEAGFVALQKVEVRVEAEVEELQQTTTYQAVLDLGPDLDLDLPFKRRTNARATPTAAYL